jgi:hypothetical protein
LEISTFLPETKINKSTENPLLLRSQATGIAGIFPPDALPCRLQPIE